jgi:hypothetical protein
LAFGCGCLSLFFVDRFPRNKFIAFGIAGCMASLIIECALDATYASASALLQPNESALKAAVAMIYVYVVFYEICLDGAQFAYLGEIFPTHLRAKGIAIGVAGICLMNIIWLQCEFDFLSDLRGLGLWANHGDSGADGFCEYPLEILFVLYHPGMSKCGDDLVPFPRYARHSVGGGCGYLWG